MFAEPWDHAALRECGVEFVQELAVLAMVNTFASGREGVPGGPDVLPSFEDTQQAGPAP